MYRRRPQAFLNVPAFVERLETRRLLSADTAMTAIQTSNDNWTIDIQESGQSSAAQNGLLQGVPTGITGIAPSTSLSGFASDLPQFWDESQFGDFVNFNPFVYPGVLTSGNLRFYPELLWETDSLWVVPEMNPLDDLLW